MSTQVNTQVTQSTPVNANGGLSELEILKAKLAEMTAKVTTLEAEKNAAITYKCRAAGEKYTDASGKEQTGTGVLSMYGLGRFPASYFESQWRRIIQEVKSGRLEAKLTEFAPKLAKKS